MSSSCTFYPPLHQGFAITIPTFNTIYRQPAQIGGGFGPEDGFGSGGDGGGGGGGASNLAISQVAFTCDTSVDPFTPDPDFSDREQQNISEIAVDCVKTNLIKVRCDTECASTPFADLFHVDGTPDAGNGTIRIGGGTDLSSASTIRVTGACSSGVDGLESWLLHVLDSGLNFRTVCFREIDVCDGENEMKMMVLASAPYTP